MKSKFLQWFAILLILEIGLLHIMTAQAEYEEAAYMGYLFAANFFGSLIAALGIYHRQVWGWMLGLVIAVGSIAGFIWSRTLGMPGMNIEEWFSPYGIVSLVVEGIYILLIMSRPWKILVPDGSSYAIGISKYLLSSTSALVVLLVAVTSYQWNYIVVTGHGHHVGSLSKVCSTPPISVAELEEKYGMQVALVATSMMDSVVDVRIKIIDPDKAHVLLQNQAALLVGQQALILAPHMHSHNSTRLKEGKIFSLFFPTRQIISRGSEVSLVFGPVRLEPVVVR